MPIQKPYGWKKARPFNGMEKSPPDGALLELKKGGQPCNCRLLLFGFHTELTSLSFLGKHLTSMPCDEFH